jgi:hypothetical protein
VLGALVFLLDSISGSTKPSKVIGMSKVTMDDGPQDAPDRIGPDYAPQRTFSEHVSHIYKAFTTK